MFVDILFISLGVVLIILGIAGCILPIIPGPPLSFGALLLLQLTSYANFEKDFLLFMAFLAIGVTILDYLVPIWGTKKYGGSKQGIWGATIGMVLGIFFFPPLGIIIGPLIGAFIGETLNGKNSDHAFRAAFGSLIGFMLGIGMKLVISSIITFHFFKHLIT